VIAYTCQPTATACICEPTIESIALVVKSLKSRAANAAKGVLRWASGGAELSGITSSCTSDKWRLSYST
jgi:hypothetical protein